VGIISTLINDSYLQSEGSVLVLEHHNYIKDLGVTFDSELKFDLHVEEKVNKASSVLGLIYRNFKYLSKNTIVMLYNTLVRSHLLFMVSIPTNWCWEGGEGANESYKNGKAVEEPLIKV